MRFDTVSVYSVNMHMYSCAQTNKCLIYLWMRQYCRVKECCRMKEEELYCHIFCGSIR